MAKKGSSAQPAAPDPTVVAGAQSAANIASAEAQQKLNMVGSTGPTGTVGYRADPTQPGGYTQYTQLSQPEQQTYDLSKGAQNQALTLAGTQLGRVGDALGQPLNTDGLPALQGSYQAQQAQGGQIQSSFNPGQPLRYGFDQGQAVQGQIGGDLEAARREAQNATYGQATSRLDPQWSRASDQLDTKLANQGLGANSTAYAAQQDMFGQAKNDAYNQAQYSSIAAGNDAAQQQFARQQAQGQFANQAAGQQYAQNQGAAAFSNATSGQDYTQNQGMAQFANEAQNQGFSQSLANAQMQNQNAQAQAQLANTARNQGLQERAYVQNQPLNQFNSLMSSGQVAMPQGIQYTPSQVGQTDVTGAYALQSQAQQAAANRAAQQQSGLASGLFSLGSAAIMASDVRVKKNIRRVGTLKPGIGLYSYEYVWGGGSRVGVLAQEVAAVNPAAIVDSGGMMAVNYGAL
jgi:hypothetical protein